jgi:antitoxin MazE
MEIPLINIGNSKGIILSKIILENYGIRDTVELVMEKDYLILKPKTTPRKGWEKAFRKMHERGEDKLLLPEIFEDENHEEWS